MPLVDNAHYADSVNYTAVTAWATGTVKAAGALVRQNAAPSVGNERVFVCVVAGTTHATTEPTWTVTRGAKTTDNTVTWQECTGLSGVNGDLTNTPNWTTIKNTAIVLGQIIKRDSGASYQICTTSGTAGNGAEPGFSDTAGTTTADNTVTWTSLGAVGNFTGAQAPHARVANALATNWGAAGNTIYVENSHAETQSTAVTWAGASTLASGQRIVCHNGGAYPPAAANVSTGATVTCSGVAAISVTGLNLYIEGVTFTTTANGGTQSCGSTQSSFTKLKNCNFVFSGAAAASNSVRFGGASGLGGRVVMENCTFTFNHASQFVGFNNGRVDWYNTASALGGATFPTSFMALVSIGGMELNAWGIDLSALGAGKTIFTPTTIPGNFTFSNCKLGGSVTKFATPTAAASRVNFINCNSADVNYDTSVGDYTGTLTTETTVVLTGGASDGTTPISWKVITTANSKFVQPFECPPIAIWNTTVGAAVTATIQGIWGGGAVPNDDEIWVEYEYLGTSGFPQSNLISDAKATVLTTASGQAAGTGTWGGSTTKFALACTFTPREVGLIIARVKCAKVSSTFYIDPKITLT